MVPVVNSQSELVEHVTAATARRALSSQQATIHTPDPFSIQLVPGLSRCTALFGRAKEHYVNFIELFQKEQDLWLQALVPGQVSVQFESAHGRALKCLVRAGDPTCITDTIPFKSIKESGDLKSLCRPRRGPNNTLRKPALKILTQVEMTKYWEDKAIDQGVLKADGSPDIEAIQMPVYDEEPDEGPRDRVDPIQKEEENDEESSLSRGGEMYDINPVNPRVLSLCFEAKSAERDADRPLASQMLTEFQALSLGLDDLHHIAQNGFYKTVKKWADRQSKKG